MHLTYVTFLARSVDTLAEFYIDGLGFEEVVASRDPRYREVVAGTAKIGFAHQGAYTVLALEDEANPTGTRGVLTFDVGRRADVQPAVDRALAHGATLVKPPFDTLFGQHLAVIRDPEGNVLRLGAKADS